jgi:hypothetical protein
MTDDQDAWAAPRSPESFEGWIHRKPFDWQQGCLVTYLYLVAMALGTVFFFGLALMVVFRGKGDDIASPYFFVVLFTILPFGALGGLVLAGLGHLSFWLWRRLRHDPRRAGIARRASTPERG